MPARVRDLRGVTEREDAALGVFITLEKRTAAMVKEAADAGLWQTKSLAGTAQPRLQILTIEELLASKRIDTPAQQDVRAFKRAPKADADVELKGMGVGFLGAAGRMSECRCT